MHFVRLRVAGFKSFVQPTDIQIESGLTGVVGPNGCGKSNVVEALRWVMGESSAKGLRGGEMDDVIFKGTSSRPAFDVAEVGLIVQRPGQQGQIEIQRRIQRGLGSDYRLDGREARARDVQLLFADGNSGARSASIVSQGQIGALVDAKGSERRRLLEAAAGVEGLHARRHEAELKLRAAEGNLERLDIVLTTRRSQLDVLQKQARQAERYRKLGEQIRRLETVHLLAVWHAAGALVEAATRRAEAAEGRAQDLAEGLADRRATRDRCQAELSEAGKRAGEAAAALARLDERARAAMAEVARLAEARDACVVRLAEAEADLAREQAVVDDAEANDRRLAEEESLTARTREACDRERDRLAEEQPALADAAEAAERHRAEAQGRLEAAEQAWRAADLAFREAQDAHRRVEAGKTAAETSLAALPVDTADALEAATWVASAEARVAETESAHAQAEREASAAAGALEAAHAGLAEARTALASADALLAEARSRAQAIAERQRLKAAREADQARRRQWLADQAAALTQRRGAHEQAVASLDCTAKQATVERLRAGCAEAEARLTDARAILANASLQRDEAGEAVRAAEGVSNELESERAGLDAVLDLGQAAAAVSQSVTVEPGFEAALTAALGDDLAAGIATDAPTHWRALAIPAGPALPGDARPLTEVVTAPAVLAARLAQIGLVDAERAAVLQVELAQGQRLVSRDGGLWRWDGLVRAPGAADGAAVRAGQQARRLALTGLLTEARTRCEGLRVALEQAEDRLSHARGSIEAADTAYRDAGQALAAAEQEARAAAAEAAALGAAGERLAQDEARLTEEASRLDDEVARHVSDGFGAEDEDTGDAVASCTAARDAAAADERQRAGALSDAQAVERRARETLAGTNAEARKAADALAAAQARMASASALAAERTRQREGLEAEIARLTADLEPLAAVERDARVSLDHCVAGKDDRIQACAQARKAEEEAVRRRDEASQRVERLSAERTQADRRQQAIAQDRAGWRERCEVAARRLEELSRRTAVLRQENERLQAEAGADTQAARLAGELAQAQQAHEASARLVAEREKALADAEADLGNAQAGLGTAREAAARDGVARDRAREERNAANAAIVQRFGRPAGAVLADLLDADRAAAAGDHRVAEAELARLRTARDRLGAVNLQAEGQAQTEEKEVTALGTERDDVASAMDRLRRAIAAINREGRERISATFAELDQHFQTLFTRLFGGGRARLVLADGDDPLATELELEASPPGKRLQSLSLLSGGEKALTALALIFALFRARPAPMCVLDEVDAPLDDANVGRLCDLMAEIAEATGTRFLVVTHHGLTMARMDRLYGVTMVERGISRLVSVDLQTAEEMRATA
ncbi:AAA family ATPase [Marinivivus vitaminiproducens]|uniref:AAA family ATPase n=1 Tax=Marinivivus vitaminiproducens TaxID=3035935 RepID=UPI00279A8952|nr:AAA family ATPase [Geminicoccaceae bacterium SCSIO 64248]